MKQTKEFVISQLQAAFPQNEIEGRAAPHVCEECNDICENLEGKTWSQVPREFVQHNYDILPLLSREGYATYLAAWLQEGVLEPSNLVADLLMINLSGDPPVDIFSSEQCHAVVNAAKYIGALRSWGDSDPDVVQEIRKIEKIWLQVW